MHRNNEIRCNSHALALEPCSQDDDDGHMVPIDRFHENTETDVYAQTERTLDIRFNGWGCSDGPGEPGCDRVEGDVDASLWHTSPVADAGA